MTVTHPAAATITLTRAQLAAMLRGTLPPPRDPTWRQTPIGQVILDYEANMRSRRLAPKTINGALTVLCPMALYFADRDITDLTGARGGRLLTDYLNRTFPTISDASYGTYVAHLKKFFKWAWAIAEVVDRDPTVGLERPRRPERRYVLFTEEEQERMIHSQPDTRDRAAIALHFDCMLRASDLARVQFQHVQMPFLIIEHGKNKTTRALPIRQETTRHLLEQHILERQPSPSEYLLYPRRIGRIGRWPDYEEKIVWEDRNRPLSYSGLNRWWRECLKTAGIEWKPFEHRMHDARHTTGTSIMRQIRRREIDADKDDLRRLMRHKSADTTEFYVHLDEAEALREVFLEGEVG